MDLEKENADSAEILNRFTPLINNANKQFLDMGELIKSYKRLVDCFEDLSKENTKIFFINFMSLFNSFVEDSTKNHDALIAYHNFLLAKIQGSANMFPSADN